MPAETNDDATMKEKEEEESASDKLHESVPNIDPFGTPPDFANMTPEERAKYYAEAGRDERRQGIEDESYEDYARSDGQSLEEDD